MILRKLKSVEHYLTRPLWERVFQEDSEAFLDYYYKEKTKDNEIYVIESEGEIRAMLHLNPYQLRIGKKEAKAHYIVAVATDAEYRGQGYMSELLTKAIRDMYSQKLPFTFLMPAAEKIYYPHHFRFIYAARQWGSCNYEEKIVKGGTLRKAELEDAEDLARFAEKTLGKKKKVYAKRSIEYYERMIKEQESQNGGILIAETEGEIRGCLLFDREEGFSVRDIICQRGWNDVFETFGVTFEEKEQKPIIMARILHLETLLAGMRCTQETELQFWLADPVIKENNKLFMLKGNREHMVVRTKNAKPKEEVQIISIDALNTLLFGYKTIEEVQKEEKENFSEEFSEQLSRIIPLKDIWLNEIV